jgi:hypothetical protein
MKKRTKQQRLVWDTVLNKHRHACYPLPRFPHLRPNGNQPVEQLIPRSNAREMPLAPCHVGDGQTVSNLPVCCPAHDDL